MENNQQLSELEQKVLASIPKGQSNARRIEVIASLAGCAERDVYTVKNSLLKRGIIIVASRYKPYGLFIPATKEEALQGIRSYSVQTSTMNKKLAFLETAIRKAFGE